MRVEPDEAEGLSAFMVEGGDAGDRADGNRMIAANGDRQLTRTQNVLHLASKVFTSSGDFRQVLDPSLRLGGFRRSDDTHVCQVARFVAELRDSLVETRDT